MKNISKRLEASVTAFKNNQFLKARLKLSIYYTAGIFLIVFIYSVVVYSLFVKNTRENIPREYIEESDNEKANLENDILDKAEDRLQAILITLNGFILILAGILSYYLAGKTLEPIEKSHSKQKKFMADSAHELKTPLSVIKAGIQAFKIGNPSIAQYKKLNSDILSELDSLINMLNDILFLERTDSLMEIKFGNADLSSLAESQVRFMRSYAENKKIFLISRIKKEVFVKGEDSYLKRMISNLIKNSIDYNKSGGQVEISLRKIGNKAELLISDTGIGISSRDISKVFDRFYKEDQSRKVSSTGAGLGLSIVKEVVISHKGKIDIKSEPDKGSDIIILLPLA